MWHLNDDGAVPPLPGRAFQEQSKQESYSKTPSAHLKPGCWAVLLDPDFADDFNAESNPDSRLRGWTVSYLGTMRVDSEGRASGDLYVQRQLWSKKGPTTVPRLPKPKNDSFPIYPIADYSLYFTLARLATKRSEATDTGAPPELLTATIATYRFDPQEKIWGTEDTLFAEELIVEKAPEAWQKVPVGEYRQWLVKNQRGTRVARLQMGWFSENLRVAEIDLTCANGLNPPETALRPDGTSICLESFFKELQWKVVVHKEIAKATADVWDVRDLHAKMLELRTSADLDAAWNYHILVVPRWLDSEEYGFGKMYDGGALDSNQVPREGLVVAAAAKFPDEERYGSARGQKLCDVPGAAFHNLLHELGHAMGLVHRFHGQGIMQGLPYIADQAVIQKKTPFPDILPLRFDEEDALRLRHYPDLWVRPGGVPFSQGYSALPVPDFEAITDVGLQLELTARPLRRKVPLGAPVKLQLRLTNKTAATLPGPALLSLSAGSVAGRVVQPGGQVQIFSGASPLDYVRTADLAPGKSIYHGEFLLRGPKGAFFPEPGRYRIEVDAGWVGPGGIARVTTQCEVEVVPPANRRHERVARKLLASKDLAAILIFRSASDSENEEVRKAFKVLKHALKTPELRGIFAPIEARRLADLDLKQAAELIDEECLMTTSEIDHLLTAVAKAKKKIRHLPQVRRMVEICRARASKAVCKNLEQRSLVERAEDSLRCC